MRPGFRAALVLALALAAGPLAADPLRVATFNASLSRNGPGVLLGDLQERRDPQIEAVVQILRTVRPDILLLNEFDYDGSGAALAAFAARLAEPGEDTEGLTMPHAFAAPSNTGWPSGLDLDGDGNVGGPGDAWGFGTFPGQYGMAVLSRHPILPDRSASFALLPWAELPGALLPERPDGSPFLSAPAQAAMRLSSKSHWDLAVEVDGRVLRLLAAHPTPPVFDGPEDRNGRRNRDEIRFWSLYLDGQAFRNDRGEAWALGEEPAVVLGDLNADPQDGDGLRAGIAGLLAHPRLQDPRPGSAGAAAAAAAQGGANARHRGAAALDTADWNDARGPGNLRVDYVLPDRRLTVLGAGVYWPAPGAPGADWAAAASDHRLVWVDLDWP